MHAIWVGHVNAHAHTLSTHARMHVRTHTRTHKYTHPHAPGGGGMRVPGGRSTASLWSPHRDDPRGPTASAAICEGGDAMIDQGLGILHPAEMRRPTASAASERMQME